MAQIAISSPAAPLPRAIRRVLGRLDRRIRMASALRAVGLGGLILALGAALGMVADFVWVLPQAARWAIWSGWLASAGAVLVIAVSRAFGRSAGPLDLAAVAERSHPHLGERLIGAVDLLGAPDFQHGSPALVAALAGDAEKRAGLIEPARAVPMRQAAKRLTLGAAAVGLVVAPGLLQPDPFGTLGRRFLAPWADLERVGRFVLRVTPGDQVVALGSDLTVSAQSRPRFGGRAMAEEAWLEWREGDGRGSTHRVAMPAQTPESPEGTTATVGESDRARVPTSSPDPTLREFSVTLPRLSSSLSYRVVSGSSASRSFRISAIEPPSVTALRLLVEPPAYTKLPATMAADPARVEAWEGSRVTLNVESSRTLRSLEVTWPPAAKPVTANLAADRKSASVTLGAEASGTYALALRDDYGLGSRPESPRRLAVRADAPPVIAVRASSDGLTESSPDDTLRVAVAARDDIAVASVELHYAIERRRGSSDGAEKSETGHIDVPVKGLGTVAARGALDLALGRLGVKPADVLSYRVRVADNRPAPRGPNVVWSDARTLTIVANAEPMLARRGRVDRDALQEKLNELKKAAAENRKGAEQLRYAADAASRGNGPWDKDHQQALERRESEARSVVDHLQLLARDFADDAGFRPLARPARQIAEVEAESGRAALAQSKRREDADERLADLRQADARLAAVSNRLEELQRDFDALARREGDAQRLRALAGREEALADHAADKASNRAQLDRLQADQDELRKQLDALLQASPDLRADVLTAQANEAEALANKARDLANRQREEARQDTKLSRRTEELKALAEEQRALENDARRFALEVDEPLAENGRGRLNVDPIRHAAEPLARGDLEDARGKLEGAEAELRRLARELDDVPADPKALARRLVRRQEQLRTQTAEAIQAVRAEHNELKTPDAKAALTARLKPLAERQSAIARLATAIQPPANRDSEQAKKFPRDLAREAVEGANRAAASLRTSSNPDEVQRRLEESDHKLRRLADALPDPWQIRGPVRQRLGEARQRADEVARELERHLRETAPKPGHPHDAVRAAAEFADRVAPLAEKQSQIAETLGKLAVEPRAEPQRDRAARRARTLSDALKAARASKSAPSERREAIRAALPVEQIDARVALERLEQKLDGRVPADDLAEELAVEQSGLHKPSATPEARAARAAEERRLATALRGLAAPDAPIAQAEAVRQAERAAQALADPDHDPSGAVRAAAESARALADRLADRQSPRARASALARAERALNGPEAPADPVQAAHAQRAIADELVRLPTRDKGTAEAEIQRAAELSERVLQPDDGHPASGRPTPTALSDARTRAAEALEALAGRSADESAKPKKPLARPAMSPADPDLAIGPKHVDAAAELARRQRQIRERMLALLGERVEPQQALRRESAEIGRALADLRDRTRAVSPRAQGPAHEAADLLGQHAPRAMDEGSEQLGQGRPSGAREAQRRAAEFLERGAQRAEDLAAALRLDLPAEKPRGESGPLGQAREAMHEASRQLDQARDPAHGSQAGRAAQQSMAQAAQALRSAAAHASAAQGQGHEGDALGESEEIAAQTPPAPGQAQGQTRDPKGTQAGKTAPDLAELQAMIKSKTGRTWGELPGHLRSEILQMSQGRYRDDYARLIQLYFREIAAGAESAQQ